VKTTVALKCTKCGHEEMPELDVETYVQWKAGEGRIQTMFPELSDDTRELMISSICGQCFDRMFADEDDADESEDMANEVDEDGGEPW